MRRPFASRRRLAWVFATLLSAGGCWSSTPTATGPATPSFPGVKITIGAIADPIALPAVAAQRGEWEASRGTSSSVLDKPLEPASATAAHVLVFRGDRLGDLVDVDALAVIPETLVRTPEAAPGGEPAAPADATPPASTEAESLNFSEVVPVFREQVSKYGNDRMALPIGGSALVLVYDRAVLERPENVETAKKEGLTLAPPADWDQLLALAKFFQGRDAKGDGSAGHGIAVAFGADPEGVGDAVFLAWAAALGQHRDDYSLLFDADSMDARLASPPFVEALKGLVALRASAPPGAEAFDAEAARAAFRQGKAALLIDRAEQASKWGGEAVKSIGVAPLPGSRKVYDRTRKDWEEGKSPNQPSYLPHGGGWLVGVSSSATGKEKEAALDFIRYLVGADTSNRIRSERAFPVLPVRSPQVAQGLSDPRLAPGVTPRAWADAVGKTLLAPRVIPGLRIPHADGYLADLARGRVAAISGKLAEEALQEVARAWDDRTKALGADRQLWHYRRSLNSLVTTPTPPRRPAK